LGREGGQERALYWFTVPVNYIYFLHSPVPFEPLLYFKVIMVE
jgi:hypothetical protein